MKITNIVVLAWSLCCSAATLPACGTSCVARAIKKTGCLPTDSQCICESEHYSGYLKYCFSKKCNPGDESDALEIATDICRIVSHDNDEKPSPADGLKVQKREAFGPGGRGGPGGGSSGRGGSWAGPPDRSGPGGGGPGGVGPWSGIPERNGPGDGGPGGGGAGSGPPGNDSPGPGPPDHQGPPGAPPPPPPPPPQTTTKPHKNPWGHHTTKGLPTKTQTWITHTKKPHHTKTWSIPWFTHTPNPTVVPGGWPW